MVRLHILTEGPTERLMVERLLQPHLLEFGVYADARSILTREHSTRYTAKGPLVITAARGGLHTYKLPRQDLERWMKEDRDCHFSTMIDLYALPVDFPGYNLAARFVNPYEKVEFLQRAFAADIDHYRFVPYLQLHELEALILADPRKLDWEYIDHENALRQLEELVAGYDSPELIDEGRETAPSKRIISVIPEYARDKARVGPVILERIGVTRLRERCPHFGMWLEKLEALGGL